MYDVINYTAKIMYDIMYDTINYIAKNTDWLFSGIICATLSILINIITKLIVRRKKSITITFKSQGGETYNLRLNKFDLDQELVTEIKRIKGDDFVNVEKINNCKASEASS